jgi:parvulin-like peptidyl-prolyl isomerase
VKLSSLLLCHALVAAVAFGQGGASPKPAAADDPVVVVINGKPLRAKELELLVRALPDAVTRSYYADKKAFLEQYALMMQLAELAEKEGIDKQFPNAQRLAYNRMLYLAQTMFAHQGVRKSTTDEDLQTYYKEHVGEMGGAKVKVLYIAFNDNPLPSTDANAKKPLTEKQAAQKADDLVKELRAGADFVKLVKENSDDQDSRSKDGDFPEIKPKDTSIPPAIRTAVFGLKPGEVSDPVKQANGFYIFKLVELTVPTLEQVRNEVMDGIQNERTKAWVDGIKSGIKIEFKDDAYLTEKKPRKN